MKATMLLVLTAAALLAACDKKATVQGEGDSKLTLVVPSAVTLVRGQTAKADIKIKRHNVPGEVTISFRKLPAGVDVVDPENRIVGESANYTFRAAADAALVEKFAAEVTATAPATPGNIAVTETINITVKEK